ncbi:hypothetical protein BASA83_012319 [Batrachochytrium salamandrivorans]|nr:hypothetical protein BASA83_012319 [Batrachochytrium salamandrivorans]
MSGLDSKAAATQLERVDGRKQWVKHADNLDRAVSDVQYDPTSILRVMQGHYGSLAADTTGHSLDLQYWHDRQPIQASLNTTNHQKQMTFLDQDFSWNQIAAALCR